MRTTGLQELQEQERVPASILDSNKCKDCLFQSCRHMPTSSLADLEGQRQLPARNSTSRPQDLPTISWEGTKRVHYYEIQQLVLGRLCPGRALITVTKKSVSERQNSSFYLSSIWITPSLGNLEVMGSTLLSWEGTGSSVHQEICPQRRG